MGADLVATLTSGWEPTLAGYLTLASVFFASGLLPVIRTPLVLASGLIFGFAAVPVIATSSTAGGMAAFVLARHLLQAHARRVIARNRLSAATLRAFDLEGWRVLALMRLYGPLPTTVQNYLFAISSISLRSFSLTTFVFSMPQLVFYVYLGSLGQMVLRGERPGMASVIGAGCALCCAVAVVLLVGHRVRTLLHEGNVTNPA